MSSDVLERLGKLLSAYHGCSNHGCLYRPRGGVGTNAICQCGVIRPQTRETLRLRAFALSMKDLAEDMAALIESQQAEIKQLQNPWVRVEESAWPPIDPDENDSVSIAVLIAYEGDNPSPLDNVCYGWADDQKWYQRGGQELKSRVLAWMPIPPLDPTPEQV